MIVRQASAADAPILATLINKIIETGGTTAHLSRFDDARMLHHYIAPPRAICCHVAEEDGLVLGFQALEWTDPDWQGEGKLPADWASIATFAGEHARGRGVGPALFAATRDAAKAAGAVAIDATIRADNALGLAYYSRMGFVDYMRRKDVPLSNGERVDRISKRFDL